MAALLRLLERIEKKEIQGFTLSHGLADVAHRIVTLEAMGRLGLPAAGLAARLKKHHAEILKLSLYPQATAKVGRCGFSLAADTRTRAPPMECPLRQRSTGRSAA